MNSCTLDAAQVGHRFGPRILFREISFSLESGQSLAVTGPNGSGKSTLLRILAGLLAPSRGRVELRVSPPDRGEADGGLDRGAGSGPKVVERALQPLYCGFVAPYMSVYGGLTAMENLAFIARARRLAGGPERAVALLERVGLKARAQDPVATFSSGMIQRMKLACALLPEPDLLLLDEPTVTLDPAGHAVVKRAIEDQLTRGGMVILATNVAAEASLCAERLELV